MFVKRYKKPIYWSENNIQFNIEIVCTERFNLIISRKNVFEKIETIKSDEVKTKNDILSDHNDNEVHFYLNDEWFRLSPKYAKNSTFHPDKFLITLLSRCN